MRLSAPNCSKVGESKTTAARVQLPPIRPPGGILGHASSAPLTPVLLRASGMARNGSRFTSGSGASPLTASVPTPERTRLDQLSCLPTAVESDSPSVCASTLSSERGPLNFLPSVSPSCSRGSSLLPRFSAGSTLHETSPPPTQQQSGRAMVSVTDAVAEEEKELRDLKQLLSAQSSRLRRRSSASTLAPEELQVLLEGLSSVSSTLSRKTTVLASSAVSDVSCTPTEVSAFRDGTSNLMASADASGVARTGSLDGPGRVRETVRHGARYACMPQRNVTGNKGVPNGEAHDAASSGLSTRNDENGEEALLAALEKESEVREARLERRAHALRKSWRTSARKEPQPIAPPPPPVTQVTSDAEVQERALAAEEFVKNLELRRKRRDTHDRRRRQRQETKASNSQNAKSVASSQADNPDGSHKVSFIEIAATEAGGEPQEQAKEEDDDEEDEEEGFLEETDSRLASANGSGVDHVRILGGSMASQDDIEAVESSQTSQALDRMSMRSCSVGKVTDSTLAVMEMLSNRPDVVLPSPKEIAVVRRGDVLSSKHILKRDLEEAMRSRQGSTGMIAGAPYFRIVPKLNIAGVAQANASAVRTIVNELRRAHVEGCIVWVNLREEPLVYINDNSYIVRERADPLTPIIIPNVTGFSIESIERKLKQEVLVEAFENAGNVSVHLENRGGDMEDQWICANRSDVLTLAEVFHRLDKETNHQVMYFRRPITQNIGPQPEDFDFVLDACLEEPKAVFVFSCQTGRGRTSSMMQIANIVRFYQLCVKDVTADVRVLREKTSTTSYRTIQKLVSLFPDGKLHERRLMILMEMADKVYSMADHINEAFSGMDDAPEVAKMRLQMYALFLVFSYYCEQRLWNFSTRLPFTQWLNEHAEMRLLIASVREKLNDQLKSERVVAPSGKGPEAEALRAIRHRRGNVLSTGRILCSLPMGADERSNIIALRQLAPGVPILTCGRVGEAMRDGLLRNIRSAFPLARSIHWISLRAEPMVLINDVSYTLADYDGNHDATEHGTTMHASMQAIEQMEDRLRRDVLLEAQDNGGYIILHHLNATGGREVKRVKVISVRTPRSRMDEFVEATGVCYARIPMPFSGQLLATDVDPLFSYLVSAEIGPNDAVVINDSGGTTRTTVALNILTLYKASRLCDLRSLQSTDDVVELLRSEGSSQLVGNAQVAAKATVAPEEIPEHHVELLLASTICQMLTAGSLLRTVDAVITLGGRGRNWNILHALDFLKKRIDVLGGNKPQCITDALHGLRCYLLVLLSCLYLNSQGDENFAVGEVRFSDWVAARAEVSNIVEHLESRGESALKYVAADNLMKADLSRRCGDVLTANFCLKADHFPGCQKKGLRPAICGAPNFRKVDFVNVYGVAIPTILGIHNVLSLLGASNEQLQAYPGQSNDTELYLGFAAQRLFEASFKPEELQSPLRGSVVWINLREEPILYVGDRPFVFRDLAAPYVNVELTGIQTEKVELVEYELKRDVLREASQYDGKFLVHDEGNPGELVGVWEVANEHTVKTLREVHEELVAKRFRCQILRLPVTDEQSPEVRDFDLLLAALLPRIAKHLDRRETLSFVFNCQMGRGRTTTGMVICCLLIGLVTPEYYDELHNAYHDSLYAESSTELGRGEYLAVTQLKRVLSLGRKAKYQVDMVLEACSKMQNLRTAIETFAIAVSSPEMTEAGRAHAHHAGVHYLKRYFNLIVFAVYLEEEYDRMVKRMQHTFTEWMSMHPEITALFETCALK